MCGLPVNLYPATPVVTDSRRFRSAFLACSAISQSKLKQPHVLQLSPSECPASGSFSSPQVTKPPENSWSSSKICQSRLKRPRCQTSSRWNLLLSWLLSKVKSHLSQGIVIPITIENPDRDCLQKFYDKISFLYSIKLSRSASIDSKALVDSLGNFPVLCIREQ